jgi:hypothetical protein
VSPCPLSAVFSDRRYLVPTVATLLKGLRESEDSIDIGNKALPISSVGPFLMEGILLEHDL